MDLSTVVALRRPTTRAQLDLRPGEAWLAGGTWLFSEPQEATTGLVDLSSLGWPAWRVTGDGGLELSAMCTIDEVARIPARPDWRAHPVLRQCCTALYGSFKVWNVATVGGNICAALPPGPMTLLGAALDADAVIWGAGGADRRMPVADFVTGMQTTDLRDGELLRAVEIPGSSMRARTAYRKIAQAEIGRSGAVLVGRVDEDGAFTLAVSASTLHPEIVRAPSVPAAGELEQALDRIDSWYSDPHGAADWREHMTRVLAEEIRQELSS